MQVDFYQLTRDPAEKILTALATKTVGEGGRLLIVSSSEEQLGIISNMLWNHKADSFLAHAVADGGADGGANGGERDAMQPILLSAGVDPANSAKFIALADGVWREEALGFERAFYLFAPERTDDARAAWRSLKDKEDVICNYWRQDGGRWVKGP